MESCEASAPNNLVLDDTRAWSSRDSSRWRYRHCCETSVHSRLACSYPALADYRRRWMADGSRRSMEPLRVYWTQRSAASRMPGQYWRWGLRARQERYCEIPAERLTGFAAGLPAIDYW